MFLTAEEIATSRQEAVSNALELTAACLSAGQRFNELLSGASRDALQHGSKHLTQFGHGQLEALVQVPATLWLEGSLRHSHLLNQTCAILGAVHRSLIEKSEAQVRVMDGMLFASLRRAARSCPWESAVTLQAWGTALEGAEQTLHGVSEAAAEAVALAEREVHQLTTALSTPTGGTRSRTSKRAMNT